MSPHLNRERMMQSADPSIQSDITRYWNFRSASYDAEPQHDVRQERERDAWTADLRALLPPPPARVLDVGAGTGFLSLLLAGMGYTVTGLDPAEGMLNAARRKSSHLANPPDFQVGDGHTPPFAEGEFDIVTSRHILWTLRDPATAFAAWHRVLRPGGRVLAIDSLWFLDERDTTRDQAPYAEAWAEHFAALKRAGLPLLRVESLEPAAELFRAAGFADVRISRLETVERLDAELAEGSARPPLPRYAITGTRVHG
jgi:ubiquinone/menaquinone biosynthesis C-methylase UbiE